MNGVSMLDLDNTKTGFTGHHMGSLVSSEFLVGGLGKISVSRHNLPLANLIIHLGLPNQFPISLDGCTIASLVLTVCFSGYYSFWVEFNKCFSPRTTQWKVLICGGGVYYKENS